MDDYHAGWKLVYGVNSSKLTQADGFAAAKMADYDAYLRGAMLSKFFGFGVGWTSADFGK